MRWGSNCPTNNFYLKISIDYIRSYKCLVNSEALILRTGNIH